MKHEEYLNKLDNLNEEFEEGLLWELQEKPPANLHGEIMKSINKERKRVNFLNYRIYAPAVAAVLLFAIAINRPELFEKLNFNRNTNMAQKQITTNVNDSALKQGSEKLMTASDPETAANNEEIKDTKDGTNIAENAQAVSDTQQKGTEADNKNSTQKNGNTAVAAGTNAAKTETPVDEDNANEESNFDLEHIVGLIFFKEPEVNYEIVLDTNRAAILNFITENNDQKLSTPNTYKLSSEQFENLDKLLAKNSIGKKVVNEPDSSSSKVVKVNLVNYHIQINDSQPAIVKFIEDPEKSTRIDKNTYKLSSENMNELEKILKAAGIKKEFIGDSEDEFVIIKTFILNYEASITANQEPIISFLKDTEKCEAVQDSIYKMSKENLIKFKELLITSGIELNVINETSNQDILVKINIIN